MSEGRGVIPSIVLNYKLNYTVELSTFFDGLILYMKKKTSKFVNCVHAQT